MSLSEMVGFKNNFGYGGIAPKLCGVLIATQSDDGVELRWSDPDDTYVNGALITSWAKTVIVRKKGDYPRTVTDGKKIVTNKQRNQYATVGYMDAEAIEEDYYYTAFPIADTGAMSINEANRFGNTEIYTFKVAINDSEPNQRVEYTDSTIGKEAASMNYLSGEFNYGSWRYAFFMPKPCMLKSDGSVDYYLDQNDFTKKEDGTESDISNESYDGNAMIEFPTVYLHQYDDGSHRYYNISNKKINSSYECYAHIDKNGKIMKNTYIPIYNGSLVDGKLRSLSGKTPINTQTDTQETTYAKANGEDWNKETLADRLLINVLLMLIGKTTDTQSAFGNGYMTGGSSASTLMNAGTMNTKGMFWGSDTANNGVKVFGVENYWGNQWRRIVGWINASGTQKIKLTNGMEDGTTVEGFNQTGVGYNTISGATPSGASGGYISKAITNQYGTFHYQSSGSGTTYECDGLWFNNAQTNIALVGGASHIGELCGAFAVTLGSTASYAHWAFGASVSCKPTVDA